MSKSDSPGIFLPPPLLFIVALGIGILVDGNVLEWDHVTHRLQLGGIGLALVGLLLIGAALGLFHRLGTRPEPWMPSSALATRGIYKWTRNPMYLGMGIVSAGIALFFESVAAAALTVAALIAIDRIVIRREEAYLVRRFGQDYDDYRKRVRRWL